MAAANSSADIPVALAALTREEYIDRAGTEGIELIMWLVMRGAMSDTIARIHETYHVPASNTAAALALFEDLGDCAGRPA